tara:strand:- start:1205 stop:1399 length:195 start_codon:yes stop_codon:yes gene_type:complete
VSPPIRLPGYLAQNQCVALAPYKPNSPWVSNLNITLLSLQYLALQVKMIVFMQLNEDPRIGKLL